MRHMLPNPLRNLDVSTSVCRTWGDASRVPDRAGALPALAGSMSPGPIATLMMDVDEAGGIAPGYELKLNSYDLGVDIELYDAVQRCGSSIPRLGTVVRPAVRTRSSPPVPTFACWPCRRTRGRSTSASSPTKPAAVSRIRANKFRPDLHRCLERNGLGRRVRVGAGLRSHPAYRRPILGGVAARAAIAGVLPAPAGSPGCPTNGMYAGSRRLLRHQIRRHRRKEGGAVALVTKSISATEMGGDRRAARGGAGRSEAGRDR